jgi:hopene-associated glycosyltransferase HpnB
VLILLGALPIAIWAYLLLGRGWFWWISPFKLAVTAHNHAERIAVVIPARDEAASMAQVVASWDAQHYDGPLRIFIVDDHSSDGTADITRHAIGNSTRFQFLSAPEKPAHWTGKLWAVSRGIEAARQFAPDYFLFTDADIVHAPDTLRALIDRATRGGYDLVSLMVRLQCSTTAEKALIPAFVFFFFLLYPPRSKATGAAGAAGGCMLVRRAALERAGGIESIRDALIDDCALAAAIQRSGGRIWLAAAESSHSLRVYRTFGEIGRMISRTAFTELHYSMLLLIATLLGLFVTYLLPVGLAVFAHGIPRAAGIAAWLGMSAAYAPTVRYYRISPAWTLTLPAIALFYAGATVHSAVRYWQGRGGEWKGRTLNNLV